MLYKHEHVCVCVTLRVIAQLCSCACYSLLCATLNTLNLSNICSPASAQCSVGFNPAVHLPSLLTLSLLRGAEQMSMHKAVKPQFGGGMRRFSCEEDNIYENIESELCFFTSQVRGQNCGCSALL